MGILSEKWVSKPVENTLRLDCIAPRVEAFLEGRRDILIPYIAALSSRE